MNASTRIQNPMPDATNEGLLIENALAFRRLVLLEIQAIKYCAALECATGQPWDQINIVNLSGEDLKELVAQNMARGLDISLDTARERVSENYATANPTQIESTTQGREGRT